MVNRIKLTKLLLMVATLFIVFFSYEAGNRYFGDPDEGRYVEIPREMVVSGDYITPRLNGLKYFEKPALFYWMQAAAIHTLGINETTMRIWPIIFAILGCLTVFFIGYKYYSMATGILSSCVLATSLLYYALSRLIILDLVNAIFISGSLWCFFAAFVKGSERKQCAINCMYIFSALACMTKGLIGAVLPALVALTWIVCTKKWHIIKEALNFKGIVLFLAIFLPWHIAVAIKNPEFTYFYFIVEHFCRYTTTIHARYQPIWFFIPILLIGLIPWTGHALMAFKNLCTPSNRTNSENVFFISWIAVILCFFSFSNSKLIPYIVPVMPPIALMVGKYIDESLSSNSSAFNKGMIANSIFITLAIVGGIISVQVVPVIFNSPEIVTLTYTCLAVLAILLILSILAIYIRPHRFTIICLFVACSANLMLIINKAAPFYQQTKKPSTKHMARTIAANKTTNDLVFCYKRYYQDCPVYLNDTVGVVDFVGELQFGASLEKDKKTLFSENEFWNMWSSINKRIFLLLSRKHYRDFFVSNDIDHKILDFDNNFIVITNK